MYVAPELPEPRIEYGFPENALDQWLKALAKQEDELKCKAAEAIALAHARGMKGLDMAIEPLRSNLDQSPPNSVVRLVAARALIALDAKQTAPTLFKQLESANPQLREIIEPALSKWDYKPARGVWLSRLEAANSSPQSLVLALHCLATVKEDKAFSSALELALNESIPPSIRLGAGRTLGALRSEGLETTAGKLLASDGKAGLISRTVALMMLQRLKSPEAIKLLQLMVKDSEPALVFMAASRLFEIDHQLLAPTVSELLTNSDFKVRKLGIEVVAKNPSEKSIPSLIEVLNDAHLDVRRRARQVLLDWAGKKEFHEPIIQTASKILATNQGRALEQAIILLTQLDYKPIAMRLVALIQFDRVEVQVTAAWALRKLAVPETLPGVMAYLEEDLKRPPREIDVAAQTRVLERGDPYIFPGVPEDHQRSQLLQFLGLSKHAAADDLLRKFIPRRLHSSWAESRAAAIWALGMVHEGKNIPALAAALEERLNDTSSFPPEDSRVRRMSAITLGRLKAMETLPSLKRHCPEQKATGSPASDACGWAIARLTGEALQPPETVKKQYLDWFLLPRN
jgi:HEAT repeat protein